METDWSYGISVSKIGDRTMEVDFTSSIYGITGSMRECDLKQYQNPIEQENLYLSLSWLNGTEPQWLSHSTTI